MVMDTIQIRLSHGLLELVDSLVKQGIYSNRADVIRDAVRRFVWEKEVGTFSNNQNSIKQVKKARKKLSKKSIKLKEINNL